MDRYALRFEIGEFLYREAILLDRWDLVAWLGLFAEQCEYSVPPTDLPEGDPSRDTFLIHDDRFLLKQRVHSLLRKTAHAEWPHSRTRRLITNVQASENETAIDVTANFAIYRVRYENLDCFVGYYDHLLVRSEEGGLLFKRRKAVMDLDALRPQTKVSIIV